MLTGGVCRAKFDQHCILKCPRQRSVAPEPGLQPATPQTPATPASPTSPPPSGPFRQDSLESDITEEIELSGSSRPDMLSYITAGVRNSVHDSAALGIEGFRTLLKTFQKRRSPCTAPAEADISTEPAEAVLDASVPLSAGQTCQQDRRILNQLYTSVMAAGVDLDESGSPSAAQDRAQVSPQARQTTDATPAGGAEQLKLPRGGQSPGSNVVISFRSNPFPSVPSAAIQPAPEQHGGMNGVRSQHEAPGSSAHASRSFANAEEAQQPTDDRRSMPSNPDSQYMAQVGASIERTAAAQAEAKSSSSQKAGPQLDPGVNVTINGAAQDAAGAVDGDPIPVPAGMLAAMVPDEQLNSIASASCTKEGMLSFHVIHAMMM